MKIKIESDVFDIVNRIKEIDNGYFIMYNFNTKRFELHNKYQKSSYCITIPYTQLDERTITLIHKTSIKNFDNVVKELDEDNKRYKEKETEKMKEVSDYKIREILKYSGAGIRNVDKAFKSNWM